MATSKQQRRADKKRRAAQARRVEAQAVPPSPSSSAAGSGSIGSAGADELIAQGLHHWFEASCDGRDRVVNALVDLDGAAADRGVAADSPKRPERSLTDGMFARLGQLWERGWQPADVVHVVRHRSTPRVARLCSAMIHEEERRAARADRMPAEWSAQLDQLPAAPDDPFDRPPLTAWAAADRTSFPDALHDALRLLGLLRWLPAIAQLADPPSRWKVGPTRPLPPLPPRPGSAASASAAAASSAASAAAVDAAAVSAKVLATIRALLAKAERTEFPAEAEAFAAKAQELMARHSIDAALLDARHGDDLVAGVRSRRIHIDDPYAKEKVGLLAAVGRANRVKVVYSQEFAFATAVGFPEDLGATDLLFTSLLVQATRALADATASLGRGRSPAFRRGFWVAYGARIGERLVQARHEAEAQVVAERGTAIVPVLAERAEAVDTILNRLFTNTRQMKTRSVDAMGWHAGRTAADLAAIDGARAVLPE